MKPKQENAYMHLLGFVLEVKQ